MKSLEAVFGPNSALVEELYNQYQENPESVPPHWRKYFDELEGKETPTPQEAQSNGSDVKAPTQPKPKKVKEEQDPSVPDSAEVEKIKGVASKIAENMDESIYVPTATSLRVLPVKMLWEDRSIINTHLLQRGEPKASFTHIIAWAVIQALFPKYKFILHSKKW